MASKLSRCALALELYNFTLERAASLKKEFVTMATKKAAEARGQLDQFQVTHASLTLTRTPTLTSTPTLTLTLTHTLTLTVGSRRGADEGGRDCTGGGGEGGLTRTHGSARSARGHRNDG